jgi:CRISPR-associated protein Cas1
VAERIEHGSKPMQPLLNTLYVSTQGAYLAKSGLSVKVRHEKNTLAQLPLHALEGLVCFGRVGVSPALLGACADSGVAISFLTERGRFLAQVTGFTRGNVLLRRRQYRLADDGAVACTLARDIVRAKLTNARTALVRAARDAPEGSDRRAVLQRQAKRLGASLEDLAGTTTLDAIRGQEGEAASQYFRAFDALQSSPPTADGFAFTCRSRRPPLDRINALLSFLYTLLLHDVRSACETVGLDPCVGFLHADRPGKPSLALDIMEEFRPALADRVAFSLINRRQIGPEGFRVEASGAVVMDDAMRKAVLVAWQQRKRETLTHPFLGETVPWGLLVHLQARLMARFLRGDLDAYPPFIWKG